MLFAVCCLLFAACCLLLAACCLLLVVGCWLVVGGWWLVVGGWWLVVGGWWLVVGCFETAEARKCLCQQSPVPVGMGSPRWRRTLHHRGLQKMALNSSRPGGARKMRKSRRKTPSHRHMTASRNIVQIFEYELRGVSGTTNTMKICEILPKAT